MRTSVLEAAMARAASQPCAPGSQGCAVQRPASPTPGPPVYLGPHPVREVGGPTVAEAGWTQSCSRPRPRTRLVGNSASPPLQTCLALAGGVRKTVHFLDDQVTLVPSVWGQVLEVPGTSCRSLPVSKRSSSPSATSTDCVWHPEFCCPHCVPPNTSPALLAQPLTSV